MHFKAHEKPPVGGRITKSGPQPASTSGFIRRYAIARLLRFNDPQRILEREMLLRLDEYPCQPPE